MQVHKFNFDHNACKFATTTKYAITCNQTKKYHINRYTQQVVTKIYMSIVAYAIGTNYRTTIDVQVAEQCGYCKFTHVTD